MIKKIALDDQRVQIRTGHGPWLFSINSAEVDSQVTPFPLNESISWLFCSNDVSALLSDPKWGTKWPLYLLCLLLSLEVTVSSTLPQTSGERQTRGQKEVWGLHTHLLCNQLSILPALSSACCEGRNRSNEGKTHSVLLYSPKFKTKPSILKRPVP